MLLTVTLTSCFAFQCCWGDLLVSRSKILDGQAHDGTRRRSVVEAVAVVGTHVAGPGFGEVLKPAV